MGRTVIAMILAAAAAVSAVTGSAFAFLGGGSFDGPLIGLAVLAMATVGALLAIRVPSNAVGWLLIASALCLGLETLGAGFGQLSLSVSGGSWPGTAVAGWLYSNLLAIPVLIITVGIPLIFPDGRLLSARWRWLVVLLVVSGVAQFMHAFRPGPISDMTVENPFGIAGIEPFLDAFDQLPDAACVFFFLGGITSVVIRYRRGSSVERQQLKWLIAATAFAVSAWCLVIVGRVIGAPVVTTIGWLGGVLAFALLPVAIGIAVLRYRLYEIDRIVSRTIAWAVVTGALVSVFAAGVVALQAVLARVTQGETVAVAVSTLVAAALFQPLRRRVQRAVDRRFDRATYDARRTVEAFAERLRDEVALDAVVADLMRRSAPRSGHRRSGCGCGRPAHEPAARRDHRASARPCRTLGPRRQGHSAST